MAAGDVPGHLSLCTRGVTSLEKQLSTDSHAIALDSGLVSVVFGADSLPSPPAVQQSPVGSFQAGPNFTLSPELLSWL